MYSFWAFLLNISIPTISLSVYFFDKLFHNDTAYDDILATETEKLEVWNKLVDLVESTDENISNISNNEPLEVEKIIKNLLDSIEISEKIIVDYKNYWDFFKYTRIQITNLEQKSQLQSNKWNTFIDMQPQNLRCSKFKYHVIGSYFEWLNSPLYGINRIIKQEHPMINLDALTRDHEWEKKKLFNNKCM